MTLARYLTHLCVFFGVAIAGTVQMPTTVKRKATLTERDEPVSTICGDIITAVNNQNSSYLSVFWAVEAYECLLSVPFNSAVALRYIDYYNTTIAFQSTLAYLRDPPAGYQQPAVDVFEELDIIKRNVTAGYYTNQYSFEVALQSIVVRMHDAHVDLNAGILAAFSFASPVRLVTASKDGKEVPKIYFQDDMIALQNGDVGIDEISPIVSINGKDADDYLSDVAALQSVGMLEPNADWNAMMANPARDIQRYRSIFGGNMRFYPGDELNFKFANDTEWPTAYVAIYTEQFFSGPLTTGGDFYNYFVLGWLPASYDEVPLPPAFNMTYTALIIGDDETLYIPYNISAAYPESPDVVQGSITRASSGFVTGYFLNDTKTGVLSIPSFDHVGWAIGNFTQAVTDFINGAQAANLDKIVIDLQQNSGGMVGLAFVTFGQFFPENDPFAGSRRRSHERADLVGQAFNDHWEGLSDDDEDKVWLMGSDWVVLERLNAETGHNFTSWAEYYGPRQFHNDNFSLTEQYDLKNPVFDAVNFDGWVPLKYVEDRDDDKNPFKPEQITILTDGACSSACSLFTEMLVQAGVRSVVVGGRPEDGPMQAVSGTRGAIPYSASSLQTDFQAARNWSQDAAVLPETLDEAIFTNWATFNLRDQIRDKDDDTNGIPLQFKYLPADCRLYYTLENVYNMSALWRDVSHAAFDDHSLCVDGWKTANSTSPPDSSKARIVTPDLDELHNLRITDDADLPDPLTDKGGPGRAVALSLCNPNDKRVANGGCGQNVFCRQTEISCRGKVSTINVCAVQCQDKCSDSDNWACNQYEVVESVSFHSTRGASVQSPGTFDIELGTRGMCVPKASSTFCNTFI